MAKPRKVDPCRTKGRYGGTRAVGRRYFIKETFETVIIRGCECAQGFLCPSARMARRLNYALNTQAQTIEEQTVLLERIGRVPDGHLLAVPCEETFLEPDSPGTQAHKNLLGGKSKFEGCKSCEEYLLQRRLVNNDIREALGKTVDVLEQQEVGSVREWDSLDPDEFFQGFTFGDTKIRPLIDFTKTVERIESFESTRAPEAASHDEIVERWKTEERQEKRIKKMLAVLTEAQREAIELVYLHNGEGLSKTVIARQLNIRTDTLQERIEQAFKKIMKHFSSEDVSSIR